MSTQQIVLSSPVRTAIGAYNGSLKTVPATDLGATGLERTICCVLMSGSSRIAGFDIGVCAPT